MALRRMFSLEVVNTDAFLDLPLSTQALYFHLGMRADDDGFVASPKRLTAMVGCSTEDMDRLVEAGLVLRFESGVCAIRHWKLNNYLQKDRYKETNCVAEKRRLRTDETGGYMLDTSCIHSVSNLDTQDRLGKVRIEKEREGKKREEKEREDTDMEKEMEKENPSFSPSLSSYKKYGRYANVCLTEEQLRTLQQKYPHSWRQGLDRISLEIHKQLLEFGEALEPEKHYSILKTCLILLDAE